MTRICRYLPLFFVLLFSIQFVNAQSGFDLNFGVGAAQDKASSTGIDQNTFLSCAPVGVSTCSATKNLSTVMLGFGGNLMLWKKFGVGAEVSIQPTKQSYALLQPAITSLGQPAIELQSRVTFFDFNGIFQPVNTKKVAVQLLGGIGGANLKFYENASGANALVGSYNQSQYAGSSNHFQVHGGFGVQIYLTDHVFLRPQFDVHYVHNLSQFGNNLVTAEMVWLGYSIGDRP
ncbi:MAG: hypothetical protein LAQ69_35625 [Acidobacteriia bacterium]|nr:hypothetical protein [Terriglobia bacterium]